MTDKRSNDSKRAFFDLFRNPEQVSRALGKAFRELRDAAYPPSVPVEEYQKALSHISALETQVQELIALHAQDQETIQQVFLQAAEQDKKLTEIIELLQNSPLEQDKPHLTRWQELHKRLTNLVITLVGLGIIEALRDAWVQEVLWPMVKTTLPEKAQKAWQELLLPKTVQGTSPAQSPLDSPLPTLSPATQLESPLSATRHASALDDKNLRGANLQNANLQGADLQNANLWKANLQVSILQRAVYNESTRWPAGFDPIAAGALLVDSANYN